MEKLELKNEDFTLEIMEMLERNETPQFNSIDVEGCLSASGSETMGSTMC